MPEVDPIKEILTRLEKYPNAKHTSAEHYVVVEPADEHGFPVSLMVTASEFIIDLGGWHEHFQDVESALNCFAFGLSDMCRLKIVSRGGKPHNWTIQSLKNEAWIDDSTTGLFLFYYWKKPKITYLQNRLIRSQNR